VEGGGGPSCRQALLSSFSSGGRVMWGHRGITLLANRRELLSLRLLQQPKTATPP